MGVKVVERERDREMKKEIGLRKKISLHPDILKKKKLINIP